MKPKTILLIILLFLSPAALGNNAGDDTDALLIAATYIGDGNGTIYRGYGTNPLNAVYTFKNGRIYKGDGRFTLSLDALYTIRDGRIFEGNNTWPYDAVDGGEQRGADAGQHEPQKAEIGKMIGKLDTLLGHGVLLSAQGAKNGSHKCP